MRTQAARAAPTFPGRTFAIVVEKVGARDDFARCKLTFLSPLAVPLYDDPALGAAIITPSAWPRMRASV